VRSTIWEGHRTRANWRSWLAEFDRVLESGGRLALTLQTLGRACDEESPFSRWTLDEAKGQITAMGYRVLHADDITERDIEIGWRALDSELTRRCAEFTEARGPDWVAMAHAVFAREVERMRSGGWGNGRIVAAKLRG